MEADLADVRGPSCLDDRARVQAWNVARPQVLIMNGDPTDNNATLFSQGYHSVLDPLFQNGTYTKVAEPAGTWDNQKALTLFQQQYQAHPNVNSVVTPNDGVANSVISALKTLQVPSKKVPTTGQDATLQGIYLKLRLLAQVENLAGRLDESCNLLWPRIILTILRDLKALGSLQEPTGEY